MGRIELGQIALRLTAAATLMSWLGSAQAQSSVTLYGQLDAGLIYTNKTLDAATGQDAGKQLSLINSGLVPSRFGVTGREPLGDGMFAKFTLECGVDMANGGFDNSNGNLFGRQAWISLGGHFGEVKLGLQYSPYLETVFELDPRSFAQFGSSMVAYAGNTFTGIFDSNAISYVTPKIGGFAAKVLMAVGGVAGNFAAGRQYSAYLKYEYGGLVVNAAILDEASSTDLAANENPFTSPVTARTFGVVYNFSEVTVKASFANYNAPETFAGAVRSGGDNDVFNAGFTYHLQPVPMDLSATVFYIKDQHDSNSHTVAASLAAQYFLSKRTSLYAQAGLVDNDGTENIGLALDGGMHAGQGTTVGATFGMTHAF